MEEEKKSSQEEQKKQTKKPFYKNWFLWAVVVGVFAIFAAVYNNQAQYDKAETLVNSLIESNASLQTIELAVYDEFSGDYDLIDSTLDKIDCDFKQNALNNAKEYIAKEGTSTVSSHLSAEGFTDEEIDYALEHKDDVGDEEEALKAAEQLSKKQDISPKEMYELLKKDGYSDHASQKAVDTVPASWTDKAKYIANQIMQDEAAISPPELEQKLKDEWFSSSSGGKLSEIVSEEVWNEKALNKAKEIRKERPDLIKFSIDTKLRYDYGFSEEQADYAIGHLEDNEADQKEAERKAKQAAIPNQGAAAYNKARDYEDIFALSKQGLYDQLIYDQFPADAAQYAVDTIDLDWNQVALKSAENYRKTMNMSNGQIYDQLVYDKFTPEQAQYAIDNLN